MLPKEQLALSAVIKLTAMAADATKKRLTGYGSVLSTRHAKAIEDICEGLAYTTVFGYMAHPAIEGEDTSKLTLAPSKVADRSYRRSTVSVSLSAGAGKTTVITEFISCLAQIPAGNGETLLDISGVLICSEKLEDLQGVYERLCTTVGADKVAWVHSRSDKLAEQEGLSPSHKGKNDWHDYPVLLMSHKKAQMADDEALMRFDAGDRAHAKGRRSLVLWDENLEYGSHRVISYDALCVAGSVITKDALAPLDPLLEPWARTALTKLSKYMSSYQRELEKERVRIDKGVPPRDLSKRPWAQLTQAERMQMAAALKRVMRLEYLHRPVYNRPVTHNIKTLESSIWGSTGKMRYTPHGKTNKDKATPSSIDDGSVLCSTKISNKITPLWIFDASCNVDYLSRSVTHNFIIPGFDTIKNHETVRTRMCSKWFTGKAKLALCPTALPSTEKVKARERRRNEKAIEQWHAKVKPEQDALFDDVWACITPHVKAGEAVLMFAAKGDAKDNAERRANSLVTDGVWTQAERDLLAIKHWGQHRASNRYKDFPVVAMLGILRRDYANASGSIAATFEATGTGGGMNDYRVTSAEDLKAFIDAERVSNVLQGLNRAKARYTIDGKAGAMHLYIWEGNAYMKKELERGIYGLSVDMAEGPTAAQRLAHANLGPLNQAKAETAAKQSGTLADILDSCTKPVVSTTELRKLAGAESLASSTWKRRRAQAMSETGWVNVEGHDGWLRRESVSPAEAVALITGL